MSVRIYRPAKSAMQSGTAASRQWVLEYEPETAKAIDPLMGWIGSTDTNGQVKLRFPSREAALAYAKRLGLDAKIEEPRSRAPIIKNYADNFRYDKVS
jgi:hypothetical protein